MSLEAIKYSNGKLSILDQLLLPFETRYIPIVSADDAWTAIKSMQVRGAPAIAIVGCLSVAVELLSPALQPASSREELSAFVSGRMRHLLTARPTAVNIKTAAREIEDLLADLNQQPQLTVEQMKDKIVSYMEGMLESDIRDNKAIGMHGAAHIRDNCTQRPLRILTHCNTGSLATAGYGTALGVVRSLRALGELDHVYFTETRPYNQGSRLTAYELVHDAIPSTLICDSMAGWAMKTRGLSAVVVGADRVAANGDTANKIGTYQLAVLASYHSVPFYVAAPLTSIDWSVESGESIPVEERPASELTCIGGHRVAAEGIGCWNPAFDVTPSQLITGGIITERGVFRPRQLTQVLRDPRRD